MYVLEKLFCRINTICRCKTLFDARQIEFKNIRKYLTDIPVANPGSYKYNISVNLFFFCYNR